MVNSALLHHELGEKPKILMQKNNEIVYTCIRNHRKVKATTSTETQDNRQGGPKEGTIDDLGGLSIQRLRPCLAVKVYRAQPEMHQCSLQSTPYDDKTTRC